MRSPIPRSNRLSLPASPEQIDPWKRPVGVLISSGVQPKVVMYRTPFCPYCSMAARLLSQLGLEFEEVDVSGDAERRRWLLEVSGQRTGPQIFINGHSVGGSPHPPRRSRRPRAPERRLPRQRLPESAVGGSEHPGLGEQVLHSHSLELLLHGGLSGRSGGGAEALHGREHSWP